MIKLEFLSKLPFFGFVMFLSNLVDIWHVNNYLNTRKKRGSCSNTKVKNKPICLPLLSYGAPHMTIITILSEVPLKVDKCGNCVRLGCVCFFCYYSNNVQFYSIGIWIVKVNMERVSNMQRVYVKLSLYCLYHPLRCAHVIRLGSLVIHILFIELTTAICVASTKLWWTSTKKRKRNYIETRTSVNLVAVMRSAHLVDCLIGYEY